MNVSFDYGFLSGFSFLVVIIIGRLAKTVVGIFFSALDLLFCNDLFGFIFITTRILDRFFSRKFEESFFCLSPGGIGS